MTMLPNVLPAVVENVWPMFEGVVVGFDRRATGCSVDDGWRVVSAEFQAERVVWYVCVTVLCHLLEEEGDNIGASVAFW